MVKPYMRVLCFVSELVSDEGRLHTCFRLLFLLGQRSLQPGVGSRMPR